MFEGSLVESRGLVVSGTRRWTTLGSLTVQCALVGLLLAIPIVRPDVLQPISVAPQLTIPLPVKPPLPIVQPRMAAASSASMSVPAAAPQASATRILTFPHPGDPTVGPAPNLLASLPFGPGGPAGPAILNLSGTGNAPSITVIKPRDTGPTRVSKGVTDGLLLAPIHPVYPPIAVAARIEGTVVLEAVISKAGRIESLHATSGPEMLRKAAMDAVAVARYRPYLLNGDPTEVQTTVTVVFRLGS